VTEARAKRASPYRRGEWAERDRWVRAAYVVLQCSYCLRRLIAGEPACVMCVDVRRLAEPDVVIR
jgi:hypothetical protein